ncbi:MAG TPA: hypothetical protein VGM68_10415 [Rhizomicrobium sp.]
MKRRATSSAKTCGACHACCVELTIDTPEFKKAPLIPCEHLKGGRCGIYNNRFKICHEFLCGWHLSPELGEEMRPDLSGVLMLVVAQASLPEAYRAAGNGMQLLVIGGEDAITRPGVADYIFEQVSRRVGLYLTATIPRAMLNAYLEPFVAAGDREGARRTLVHVYRLLTASGKKKGLLGLLPYLYRIQLEKMQIKPNRQ